MTGVAIMLKSMGLDLSPAGLTKLLEDTGIGPKIVEAQKIVSGFISHIDARFDAIDKRLDLERNSHTETHRQLELMNTYLEALTVKLSQMHEDILDKGAAGAHTVDGAVLVDPFVGYEMIDGNLVKTSPTAERDDSGIIYEVELPVDAGTDSKPN